MLNGSANLALCMLSIYSENKNEEVYCLSLDVAMEYNGQYGTNLTQVKRNSQLQKFDRINVAQM